MKGWIRIWRENIEPLVYEDNENLLLLGLYTYISTRVSTVPTVVSIDGQVIQLSPGMGIFSQLKLANLVGKSRKTMSNRLDVLQKLQLISVQSRNKFTLISVVGWSVMQGEVASKSHQSSNTLAHYKNKRIKELNIEQILKKMENGEIATLGELIQILPKEFSNFIEQKKRQFDEAGKILSIDRALKELEKIVSTPKPKKSDGEKKQIELSEEKKLEIKEKLGKTKKVFNSV